MLSLQEKYICLHCDADLPLTYDWNREQNAMSDRYNQRIQDWLCAGYSSPASAAGGGSAVAGGDGAVAGGSAVASSAAGVAVTEPYQRACALFYYDAAAGYKEIPQALKYGGALSMGRHFARRLGARLAESPLYEDVDLIVPVPLHGFRHFRRGYNQAEIIARALAEKMGKSDKLCVNLLRRTRHTKTQTQLSIEQKQRNVADAFRVSPRSLALLSRRTSGASVPASASANSAAPARCAPAPSAALSPSAVLSASVPATSATPARCAPSVSASAPSGFPRHILLVDDVFTTGSTLSQCHKALRQVFPPTVRISVATLAFVGEG
ncbi:MAG: ComF family protein [Bacteroidales bacterium]|nr:ComF family protein [Bacteroidales bacterium]